MKEQAMKFQIDPASLTEIFPVPKAVVEENISLASPLALKALLLLLCAGGNTPTVAELAAALRRDEAEIEDALLFWVERGILRREGDAPAPRPLKAEPVPAPKAQEEKKTVPDLPLSRPTHEQIAARVAECEAFRELFQEAQLKLGKTIGYEGQSLLIMLHDTYDLPLEVILMLLEYAKSKGKTGYKYIASIGREWSENEIDSLESAQEYIAAQESADALWDTFRSQTGVKNRNPTAKQRRYLAVWSKELQMSADMILLAYEISADNTGKLSLEYMDKVLRSWKEKQVKTPADAEREKQAWNAKRTASSGRKGAQNKPAVFSSDASYDLEEYGRSAVGLVGIVPKSNQN